MSQTTEIKTVRKRASMGPSNVVIQHTTPNAFRASMSGPGSSTIIRRTNVTNVYSAPQVFRPQGEASKMGKEAVQNVVGTRGNEKKALGDLNSKLADYIEKVRFVEATNKALMEEVERLRKMKGYTQERVRDEYQEEIEEARATIAQLSKELAPLQAKILALEDQVETKDEEINALKKQRQDLENQIQKLTQMLGELEGETATLRHQLEANSRENDMLKQDVNRLRDDNDRIRHDYEVAVTKQIEAQNERDALAEELHFIKDTSEAEITELRELLANFQSVQPKIEKMWQSEFKSVVQELQAQFNDQLAQLTAQQQQRYDEQLANMQHNLRKDNTDSNVVKSENKMLKEQLKDLRDRLDDLEKEILSIQNAQRRDNTDAVSKSELKTLKSQMSEFKNRIADLERENERLLRELEDLKRRHDQENQENEEEKQILREEIEVRKAELEDVFRALQELRDSNLSLELEISCYKKLLEGEETKIQRTLESQGKVQTEGGSALASLISGGGGSMSQTSNPERNKQNKSPVQAPGEGTGKQPNKPKSQPQPKPQPKPEPIITMSESTGHVRVSRSSKCAISIKEIDLYGRYIMLSNSSKTKEFDLGSWVLERDHPKGKSSFTFDKSYKLAADKDVKVFSDNYSEEAGPNDLKASRSTCKVWGHGNGKVSLKDDSGQEKANSTITYS